MNFLENKIRPLDPDKIGSVEDLLDNLKYCGFQGRNLGKAFDIFKEIVDKPVLKIFCISGAMIPAGMGEIIIKLIEYKIIDAIISTGANITHDVVNALATPDAQSHYIGSHDVDDDLLKKERINRIYNVFLPENNYEITEKELLPLLKNITKKVMTPSQIIKIIGAGIKNRSFISTAARYSVPVFCGAFSDSELGLDILKYNQKKQTKIILDELEDIQIFGELIKKHHEHATIIIGGGVPRNWAQQIFPYLDSWNPGKTPYKGYTYSIRLHTAVPQDGGLSGCTISESKSWGKYKEKGKYISVWGDATITFPLLATAIINYVKKKRQDRLR